MVNPFQASTQILKVQIAFIGDVEGAEQLLDPPIWVDWIASGDDNPPISWATHLRGLEIFIVGDQMSKRTGHTD